MQGNWEYYFVSDKQRHRQIEHITPSAGVFLLCYALIHKYTDLINSNSAVVTL